MHIPNKRRTRSSGSVLDQINGDCGGEIKSTVNKVSEQSSTCVPPKTSEAESHLINLEKSSNDANENGYLHEEMMANRKGISNGFSGEEQTSTPDTGSHRKLVIGLPCRGQFEIQRSSKKLGEGGSHRRARKSEEAVASSSVNANSTPVHRPKNMKKGKVREDDEYTRIKRKLRYFLNRIKYEQSLIDAYSLEGWKGSSLEKLRPEKELERATKEILLRKVKIRDLFQHLDTLCAEGSLPETLFDSDGEISSEDIFCAKCGSKDLSLDNDIILCDGFCDRGFHQYCVEPPLRKEDIPPDDESWLCPGCDCKDDSLGLLNDSLGTKLSVGDSWEKVFPEAAAAMAGGDQNLNCDLPSDDSDDEEYDPDKVIDDDNDEDGSDKNDESENEDGSSDESDFTSASDEMIGSFKKVKDIMDLPSDDSEDDDYNPDALTLDEDTIQENSNSDDTSDSETSLNGDDSNQQDNVTPLGKPDRKESQIPDISISESEAGVDQGLANVPGRRSVERLDYKKLYDEEYENVPSSSSDDEDWDKTAGEEDSESADEGDTVPLKQSSKAEDDTATKKPIQKTKRGNSLKVTQEAAPGENDCTGDKSSSSACKQDDTRTQKLFKAFQVNRYPDNTTRENLAKELQMTVKQVNNWFRNRRFSTSKTMVYVENSRTSEGETSVAGSSAQTMETELVAENKSRASESTNNGSRKRRRM